MDKRKNEWAWMPFKYKEGGETMRNILCAVLLICGTVQIILILLQKKREGGLGALTGKNTYWKKGMGQQGKMEQMTRVTAAIFMLTATALYIMN